MPCLICLCLIAHLHGHFELATPAGIKRGINLAGTLVAAQCRGWHLLGTQQMPLFLMAPPMLGHNQQQAIEIRLCLLPLAQVAVTHCRHVEHVGLVDILVQQRCELLQRHNELLARDESLDGSQLLSGFVSGHPIPRFTLLIDAIVLK